MSLKIVITDCSWGEIDIEEKYLPQDAIVKGYQCKTEEEVIDACKDADAILAEYAPLNKNVLSQLKKCKIISNTSIGVDNIDINGANELGIAVANVPGYCAIDVAEHTMALILANRRNIVNYNKAVQNHIWNIDCVPPLRRLAGQVLGLVGFGSISQNVAIRAQSFGMKVITYSSVPKELTSSLGVDSVDLEYLLNESDIISSHIPLSEKNRGFFDSKKFQSMKKKPLFVNTSRGGVVNEEDLVEALNKNYISGAALDVLQNEPPQATNTLLNMDNVILTPHAGFCSVEALEEVRRRSALNVTNYFNKKYKDINYINYIGD